MRAPGEGYTGPIADPNEAMRAALASQDVLAQAAKDAADPDAPIGADLSAMEMWKNPGQYAEYPGAARAPSQAERNADAIRAGMDRTRAAGTGEGTKVAQVALPLPVPPSAGRMTDAAPPAGRPGMAEGAARASRRLRHIGEETGRPFSDAVDASAPAAMWVERHGRASPRLTTTRPRC